jgi:hypothetical protein
LTVVGKLLKIKVERPLSGLSAAKAAYQEQHQELQIKVAPGYLPLN